MNAPLIICNGLIRSGSTWSFNVCRELARELGRQRGEVSTSCYFSKEQLDGFIKTQWKRAEGPTVVKAHELGPGALATLYSGRSKAICTYRDPRDCVASDLTFLGRDFEYVLGRIAYSFEFLRYYLANENVLLVRYEQMMADSRAAVQRVAEYLGASLDAKMTGEIDGRTNLMGSLKVCDSLKTRAEAEVLNLDSHRVDPHTHLHENHIVSGTSGRWRAELSGEQIVRVNAVLGEWVRKLGYANE